MSSVPKTVLSEAAIAVRGWQSGLDRGAEAQSRRPRAGLRARGLDAHGRAIPRTAGGYWPSTFHDYGLRV